jgi:hypothetical protein
MNSSMLLRTLRPALVVAAAAAFSACHSDEISPLGSTPAGADLTVGIEVSSMRASTGSNVAVAIVAESPVALGDLQGTFKFNPSALKYVGQTPEGRTLVTVNSSRANLGELRLSSINVETGLPRRTATLVFQVAKAGYTDGFKYVFETAGDKGTTMTIAKATIASGIAEAVDLAVPSSPKIMTMADWNNALYPELVAAEGKVKVNSPGQYLQDLKYGNANLSAESPSCGAVAGSSVNSIDASYIANVAVGNINVLRDTSGTQVRDGVIAGNVFPFSTPIPGIEANGTRRIDSQDAAAVANEAVGNARPVVCDPIPGRSALPTLRDSIITNITTNTTWDNTQVHVLGGFIRVNNNATLTILPGTRIEGSTASNPAGLLVERGAKIVAVGNVNEPIVFSCNSAVKFKGCWAGLLIAGRAPINTNLAGTTNTSPDGGCLETPFEGTTATAELFLYGGCTQNDSSGALKYVRVEYGGFVFTANKELNNLTLAGVGSRTVIDYVQAHGGKDDGLEIFGGSVDVKHYIGTANQDDSYDLSSGWTGRGQFIIIQHDSIDSDKGMEIDNTEAVATYGDDTPCVPGAADPLTGDIRCTNAGTLRPRTRSQTYNVTMIGRKDVSGTLIAQSGNPCSGATLNSSTPRFAGGDVSCGAIHLRRGARPDIVNVVAEGWRYLLDLDDAATALGDSPADFTTVLHINAVNYNNIFRLDELDTETLFGPYTPAPGGSIEDDYLTDAVRNAANASSATEMLRDPYNVMYPDFRPVSATVVAGGLTPPNDGFFDVTATYKGAVAPDGFGLSSIPWYSGWTRPWTDAVTP